MEEFAESLGLAMAPTVKLPEQATTWEGRDHAAGHLAIAPSGKSDQNTKGGKANYGCRRF